MVAYFDIIRGKGVCGGDSTRREGGRETERLALTRSTCFSMPGIRRELRFDSFGNRGYLHICLYTLVHIRLQWF
jgi:hypothetical protein